MYLWSLDEDPKSLQSPNKLLPKEISPQMVDQITKALETGSASFKIPNNRKKIKVLEKFASKRGVILSIEGENVILKKVA